MGKIISKVIIAFYCLNVLGCGNDAVETDSGVYDGNNERIGTFIPSKEYKGNYLILTDTGYTIELDKAGKHRKVWDNKIYYTSNDCSDEGYINILDQNPETFLNPKSVFSFGASWSELKNRIYSIKNETIETAKINSIAEYDSTQEKKDCGTNIDEDTFIFTVGLYQYREISATETQIKLFYPAPITIKD